MNFKRLYVLEAKAYRKVYDEAEPLDTCRFIANADSARPDERSADQILDAAAAKEYEIRHLTDWDCRGQEKERTKTLCEWKFQERLREKSIVAGWVDILFKGMVYVPAEAQ